MRSSRALVVEKRRGLITETRTLSIKRPWTEAVRKPEANKSEGKSKESLHCVLKERRLYFILTMQKRKKRSRNLTDPESDSSRVPNLKRKELDSQVMGPKVTSSI